MAARSNRAVPPLRRAFGAHLRAVRQARGLSQDCLGLKAGLSGKFVDEVERGRWRPRGLGGRGFPRLLSRLTTFRRPL